MHADVLPFLTLDLFNIGVDWAAFYRHHTNGRTGFIVDNNLTIHTKTSGAVAGNRVAIDDDIEHREVTDSSRFETYLCRVANSRNCDRSFLGDLEGTRFPNSAFIVSSKNIGREIEGLSARLHKRKRMYLDCMIRI